MNQLFKFGIALFFFRFVVGYGGLGLAGLLYMYTNNNFWLLVESGLYGFSWIILGAAFLICGKEGINWYIKKEKCKEI